MRLEVESCMNERYKKFLARLCLHVLHELGLHPFQRSDMVRDEFEALSDVLNVI